MNDNNKQNYEISLLSNKNEIVKSIENHKIAIIDEMIKYGDDHKKEIYNKDGEIIDFVVVTNPLVVFNTFFKPIVPLDMGEPVYNAEKLALIFEYYTFILTNVNDKIGNYPSSLTSFCKLAGISIETLRRYKKSADLDLRLLVEKIYDQINDENLTMSQLGMVREKTTAYKLKSQNELLEKTQPNVNISLKETISKEEIDDKISKYRDFIDANIVKGGKYEKQINRK